MILFSRDWNRFPGAMIDVHTPNQSFVRLSALYRSLGIKNHAFLLTLVNPEIHGVDPHSAQLTELQRALIAIEAKINPWYYFREIARAPAIGGGASVPMEANRGNIALFWLFFNHVMTFLIQIRQTGKSFSTDTLMTYLMHIACEDTEINLLTKDDALRRTNVTRLKDIASELPSYLNQRTKEDTANTEEITVKRLGNRYKTHVPQASPKRALNLGRGMTSGIFHVDEPPFQPNISIALPAALAATGAAVDRARAAGAHYGTILTTTAGRKDDVDGQYVYVLLQESAVWTEKFFDAPDRRTLYKIIRGASPRGKLRVNITMNHRQLGKTDAWLLSKLEESLQTGDAANRDYFNMWTSGSQTSPLPTHILEKMRRSVRETQYTQIFPINSYVIRWYIPEDQIEYRMNNSSVVIGCDTSNASGGDDITMYFVDTESMETLGAVNVNETNLIHFSKWLASLLMRFTRSTLIIENRSTGQMIIDYLLIELLAVGIDPFKRIYNSVVQNKNENPMLYEDAMRAARTQDQSAYVRFKKTFGFTTSGTGENARSLLYSQVLQLAAKRTAEKLYDKTLVDQTTGLITKNGRVDHATGEHDDMTFAWLLTHWLMNHGQNLRHYGIDSSRIGCLLNAAEGHDPLAAQLDREQEDVRKRITELAEKITQSKDPFLSARIEQEMRVLSRNVVMKDNELFNIDEVIRTAKENKKTNQAQGGPQGVRPGQNQNRGSWSSSNRPNPYYGGSNGAASNQPFYSGFGTGGFGGFGMRR